MLRKDMAGVDSLTGAVNVTTGTMIDVNYAACDLLHYDGCRISVHVGNSGDTLGASLDIQLEVEHSDDASTWSDCANADLTTFVAGSNTGTFAHIDAPGEDSLIFQTEYLNDKRFIRCVMNVTGTHTNGTPIAVTYDRFRKDVI